MRRSRETEKKRRTEMTKRHIERKPMGDANKRGGEERRMLATGRRETTKREAEERQKTY